MDTGFFERQILHYGVAFADQTGHYAIEDLPPGLFVVLNVLEGPRAAEGGRAESARAAGARRGQCACASTFRAAATRAPRSKGRCSRATARRSPSATSRSCPRRNGASWSRRAARRRPLRLPEPPSGTLPRLRRWQPRRRDRVPDRGRVPKAPVFRPVVRAGSRVAAWPRHRGGDRTRSALEHARPRRGGRRRGRFVEDRRRPEGRYALRLLQPGKYQHRVLARRALWPGDARRRRGRRFGETADCDFALHRRAMTVRVLDDAGSAVEGARLTFTDAAGRSVGFSPDRTDPNGEFVVRGAKPGRWKPSPSTRAPSPPRPPGPRRGRDRTRRDPTPSRPLIPARNHQSPHCCSSPPSSSPSPSATRSSGSARRRTRARSPSGGDRGRRGAPRARRSRRRGASARPRRGRPEAPRGDGLPLERVDARARRRDRGRGRAGRGGSPRRDGLRARRRPPRRPRRNPPRNRRSTCSRRSAT